MHVYIKDKETFSLKYYSIALNYDLTLKSIYNKTSTLLIKGDFNDVKAGDFLFADNNAFLVNKCIITVIVIILNFFISKFFAFKKLSKKD